MRRIFTLTAILVVLVATAGTSVAQPVISLIPDGPRASGRIGYGGRGVDLEASIDSPMIFDVVRVRAAVGQGRWKDEFDSLPPAGTDPAVMRLVASMLYFPSRHALDPIRPFVGVGIGAFIPRGVEMNTQAGVHLIAGMEGSGERWTVGPEVELDVPRPGEVQRPRVGNNLLLTARIGIAIRRRF